MNPARNRLASAPGLTSRLALIVGLGLALRLAVLVARYANDPAFHTFPPGSDQISYVEFAHGLLDGTWPTGAFYKQPGISYYLALVMRLVGDDLVRVRLVTLTLGALSSLLMFHAARLSFGSRHVGLLAALMYALYPVSAFYDTTVLIPAPTTLLTLAALTVLAGLVRRPRAGWAALAGVLIGLATFFRVTVLALLPSGWLAAWLGGGSLRRQLGLAGLVTLTTALTLAPVTWWNTVHEGRLVVLTTGGPNALYGGNNRDAGGTYAYTQAYRAEHRDGQNWVEQTWLDVRAEPGRALGLYIRKLGLTWGNLEIGSNLSYRRNGLQAAPILYFSPLNFGLLALLGLSGLALAWRRWPVSRALGLFLAGYSLGGSLIFMAGRHRMPMVPALVILGAGFLVEGWRTLVKGEAEAWRRMWLALAVSGLILSTLALGAATLPRPRFLRSAELPPDVTPSNLTFGGSLRLLGYRLNRQQARPDGPLLVTCYWQANQRIPVDYSVFLYLADPDGKQWGQGEVIIGTVSHPHRPLTTWQPGAVFREEVMVVLSSRTPAPSSLALWGGVYNRQTGERLPIDDGLGGDYPDNVALLASVRVVPRRFEETQATLYRFGPALALADFSLSPEEPAPGGELTLTLTWRADAAPGQDMTIFVHLLDQDGNLVAQHDGLPREGLMPTLAWQAGDVIDDPHPLALPPDAPPGQYTLRIGVYESATKERLAVIDADGQPVSDNVAVLTTVTLR
jgi:4-amino-4-deoxy-L-arabinose transferase-like glycosyltransferase